MGRKAAWAAGLCVALAAMVLADRVGVFGKAPPRDVEKYHLAGFVVVNVVDGDTLDVDCPDGDWPRTRVRLWGVDTPETHKPNGAPPDHFGPEATAFTKALTYGRIVKLELDSRQTRDRYGRLLAYVILPDERMLNRLIVEQGYGYADPRYDHRYKSDFARLQRRALSARAGLWASVRRDDLPYYYHDTLKLPEE